jgi:hypothetical protein
MGGGIATARLTDGESQAGRTPALRACARDDTDCVDLRLPEVAITPNLRI